MRLIGIGALAIILGFVSFRVYQAIKSNLTFSFNGIMEEKCIDGYKFVSNKSYGGSIGIVQIIGDDGKPVKCEK